MKGVALCLLLLVPATALAIPSTPSLGVAEGRCRSNEAGPSFLVNAVGLKDRRGIIKVELYAANDSDFLADDNKLIAAGKTFRRAFLNVPASGPVQLCIRAPAPGGWALSMLHDRDGNGKFGLSVDGVGFPSNPGSLGPSRPSVALGRATAGDGPTAITVRLLYRRGLFSFGPAK